ncbi:unnamed protein product [Macrosiphum euphorbiae]|uniref:Uncharacterized protein n=1 Tax=Macrosiphum euphorbiae TaxID=13131 RepID=A0AAV0VN47_9HEMI|nr:unnamed protein product [Macrosiphum euphorbiae]
MSFPFSETNIIENISTQISNLFDMDSTKFESEIIKIKSVIFLKARGSETNFWNLLSEEKYPGLRNQLATIRQITTNWSTTCNVTLQQWPDQQNNMLIKLI